MSVAPDVERVYRLIDAEDYETAESLIQRLRSEGCSHCDLLLYEAICVYERQQDIECLRLLADFLREVPRHGKRHYAIFTAAVCLMNVGLESRARALLQKVPDNLSGPGQGAEGFERGSGQAEESGGACQRHSIALGGILKSESRLHRLALQS
jgi:hypothetical protein